MSTRRQPRQVETEHVTSSAGEHGGLSPRFGETVHLLAAEPHETILRVAVLESDEENASVETRRSEAAGLRKEISQLRRGSRALGLALASR